MIPNSSAQPKIVLEWKQNIVKPDGFILVANGHKKRNSNEKPGRILFVADFIAKQYIFQPVEHLLYHACVGYLSNPDTLDFIS